jgi:hypothetical protein
MMGSLRFPSHAALLATVEGGCVDIVGHLNICWNVTWIGKSSSEMRKYRHQAKPIENNKVKYSIE